ncbi:MAG TPA: glutamate--cysteine ligase [Actinophytocola sp.]|uniref:carboxylate-amine ligase n=1 Tax=Actinophytocola sp. TaxID=1872138 RepID=UPI002DBEE875|nr:glutamate--cysteine ligase [Actinophytocola sp.]HEU5473245.1 glutamate--cysteine ligase [Actinophytocola sp.]
MTTELTVGVEEEFFLVDRNGFLTQQAPETLDEADHTGADLQAELLRCQIESASEPHRHADALVADLRGLRERLADGASRRAARLLPTSTPLRAEPDRPVIAPDPRYLRMAHHLGGLVFTGPTCGCHVHVGIDDRATALRVSNHLRPWLPALLALSGNSPFDGSGMSGYASARYLLWARWPTAGPPPYLESVDHYESIVQGMLRTEAMLDRKMVYWDIRPSEHQPTLEIRVCDTAGTAEEAALYGVLVRSLVHLALEHNRPAPRLPHEVVRAGLWRAARDGLSGKCPDPRTGDLRPVHQILRDLRDRAAVDLKRTGELSFVDTMLGWLAEHGGGADRQRAAYERRHRLTDVVDEMASRALLPFGTG